MYVTLTFWLFLVLFAGIAVHRMLSRFGKSKWVDWALLPGTIVSEMAYIFGCLITGAEVRHAKLISSEPKTYRTRRSKRSYDQQESESPQTTEAKPRLKVAGPMISALVAIVGCIAAIVLAHWLLGGPIIEQFVTIDSLMPETLPKTLPTSWDGFWESLSGQVDLLRRMAETLGEADWLDWRVGAFVYVAMCLSIRLAPVRRPVRPTLAAAAIIAVLIALAAFVNESFDELISDIWPLLTYIWASLLFLLIVTFIAAGAVYLVGVLSGKQK